MYIYTFTNTKTETFCFTDTNGNGGSICSVEPVILLMSKPHEFAALTRTRFSQLSDLFHAVPRHAIVIIRDASEYPLHTRSNRWNIIVGITRRYC